MMRILPRKSYPGNKNMMVKGLHFYYICHRDILYAMFETVFCDRYMYLFYYNKESSSLECLYVILYVYVSFDDE